MSQETSQQELSPEEEIRELERRLEEKKRELAERGRAVPQQEEKKILREVLKQYIEQARQAPAEEKPTAAPPPAAIPLMDELRKKAEELKRKEVREQQVAALIELAMTRGINTAVNIAKAATPWLLDELHDHLIDDYYDKLVALRRIPSI